MSRLSRKNRKFPFTVPVLNDLKPENGKAVEYRDGKPGSVGTGLVMRVEPTGVKTLYATYKVARADGKPRRVRLGRWDGELDTLIQARARAVELTTQARAGVDPEPERAQPTPEPERVPTVAELVEWYKDFNDNVRMNGYPLLHRELVKERWGDEPVSAITPQRFRKLLYEMTEGDTPLRAQRLHNYGQTFFKRAFARFDIELPNPAELGDKHESVLRPLWAEAKTPSAAAHPEWEDDEIAQVWPAMIEWGYPYGTFVRLCILSGVRGSALARIRWADVKDDHIDMQYGSRKKVCPKLPITPAIRELLDEAKEHGSGDRVFPGETQAKYMRRRVGNIKKRTVMVNRREYETLIDIKGLQATLETRMAALRIPGDVIDYFKDRALEGTRKNYRRHVPLDEAREALEKYEAHLMAVISANALCR